MTNTNTAADSVTAILFEHEDGRYAINPNTTGDPAWHRLGPVDVSAIAAEPAQPVAQEGGTLVKLIEKKIAGMSPSEASAFMAARAALAASGNDQAAPDMRDPYGGAREDLAIWRKRALEAEALNRKFATSVNGPTFMGEPADSDSALMAREIHESQEDTLLICASDLQHSAIYDNHIEMQSCIRAVADRITALASVIEGVGRAALAAPAQPVPAPGAPAQAGEYQPSSAEMVMAALDTEEWGLERMQRWDCLTDEGNREGAWLVKRQKAPYCADKPGALYGPRSWSGPTALDALQKAADDLGIRLPQPAVAIAAKQGGQ